MKNWFTGKDKIPLWFQLIYFKKHEMVVSCFKRNFLKNSFVFQGSTYLETVNGGYRKVGLERKLQLYSIPTALREASIRRIEEQEKNDEKASTCMYHIIWFSGLFRNDLLASEFNITYTTYNMKTWTKRAVPLPRIWKANTFIHSLHEESGQKDSTYRLRGDIVFRQENIEELQSISDDILENFDPK